MLLSARANKLLERIDRLNLPGLDVALDSARVLVEEEFRSLMEAHEDDGVECPQAKRGMERHKGEC